MGREPARAATATTGTASRPTGISPQARPHQVPTRRPPPRTVRNTARTCPKVRSITSRLSRTRASPVTIRATAKVSGPRNGRRRGRGGGGGPQAAAGSGGGGGGDQTGRSADGGGGSWPGAGAGARGAVVVVVSTGGAGGSGAVATVEPGPGPAPPGGRRSGGSASSWRNRNTPNAISTIAQITEGSEKALARMATASRIRPTPM